MRDEDFRDGGTMAQRTIRTELVVEAPPTLHDDASFGEGVKDLAIERFVPELAVEGLAVTVLPG
jgi:hypothetical protein